MSQELETYDELVTRIAYYIVHGVAKGVSAELMATHAVQQTALWRKMHDFADGKRKEK